MASIILPTQQRYVENEFNSFLGLFQEMQKRHQVLFQKCLHVLCYNQPLSLTAREIDWIKNTRLVTRHEALQEALPILGYCYFPEQNSWSTHLVGRQRNPQPLDSLPFDFSWLCLKQILQTERQLETYCSWLRSLNQANIPTKNLMNSLCSLPPSRLRSRLALELVLLTHFIDPSLFEEKYRFAPVVGPVWLNVGKEGYQLLKKNCLEGKIEINRALIRNFGFLWGSERGIAILEKEVLDRGKMLFETKQFEDRLEKSRSSLPLGG